MTILADEQAYERSVSNPHATLSRYIDNFANLMVYLPVSPSCILNYRTIRTSTLKRRKLLWSLLNSSPKNGVAITFR
jgi:hypothetical protein